MARVSGLLLQGAAARLRAPCVAIVVLWVVVLWACLTEPDAPRPGAAPASVQPPSPAPRTPAVMADILSSGPIPVVRSGQRSPVGGIFDRFDVNAQPIAAPVNAAGQVAFYASILRDKAREGIFLASAGQIIKAAAVGDRVPGGGILSEFAKHPMPALNNHGTIAFGAALTGANGGEGMFLSRGGVLTVVALAGADAPGVVGGTFAEFDAPALNDGEDMVFVALVRRGRETFQALYRLSNGRLRKLIAEGDPVPGGGTFDKFGIPSINNRGVIAFPASLDHAPALGGIFVTGTRDLKLLAAVGTLAPDGRMMVRFSERVAIDDDDDIAFGAVLGAGKTAAEAVMMVNTTGLELLAVTGAPAPGGGRFAGFGPWPSAGPAGRVVFVAALEDGPGQTGIYASRSGTLSRVILTGDPLPGGGVLAPFAINAVTSAGQDGGVTFATMTGTAEGHRIYYFKPKTE